MKTNGYAERAILNRLAKHTANSVRHGMETRTEILAQNVQSHSKDGIDENTARATTRRALGRLREKGLVEEYESEAKRRQKMWAVTEAGVDEAREIREAFEEQRRKYGMIGQ